VAISCPGSDFRYLSSVKGNLPILEVLEIVLQGTESEAVTCFEVAPRLRDFAVTGSLLPDVSTPPLERMAKVRCLNMASTDISNAVPTMARLSMTNSFCLQYYLDDWTANRSETLDLGIAHTSSDVGHLAIEVLGEFYQHHCQQALGAIFTGLTLPCLRGLTFDSEKYPRFPLVWPHTQFLALCRRSAFNTHLQSLCLYHVHITEPQLLQCLSALPALTDLAIADHERIRGRGVNLELVTDTLLCALTRTEGNPDAPCLVPHLDTFRMRSRLRFTDSVYLYLVLSRLEPTGRRFTSELDILPHWTVGREIDGAVVERLQALVVQGHLVMSFPRGSG
jgi:hypothetical protein